ncbi:autophagy-related protein 13 [Octopus bimaculoides]|uniref:Autophagy-related protein 13 n=1 Tax=Octopus bimaculoides TaxID=37653 RepID=A0A0L8HC58_OCTBM|nr:autophagy-related protein 13 [Octopus bimaculoides]|eukprot:XP_014773589.1 PREDICTED: autophagy-related protein 13-like [Octopus bimaculoides]
MYGMNNQNISSSESKDLEKFLRSFSIIAVQAIVQSRLGERIQTKNSSPSQYWFSPTLKDVPELNRHARSFTTGYQPLSGQTVCVEISLKTTEGDSMVLETWHMGLKMSSDNKENQDRENRVPHVLYSKMCLALRSLIYTSRITPGYTLSRKQGPDNYIICYKIYYGTPQLHELGPDHQRLKAGRFPTSMGIMSIIVDYRTNMQISQHKTTKHIAIEMKDDHYKAETGSPRKSTAPRPCHPGHRRIGNIPENISTNEVDGQQGPFYDCTVDIEQQISNPVVNGYVPKSQPIDIRQQVNGHRNECEFSDSDKENDYLDERVVGAFASDLHYNLNKTCSNAMEDIPFITLLQNANKPPQQSCSPSAISHNSGAEDLVASSESEPAVSDHLLQQYGNGTTSDDDDDDDDEENCNKEGFVLIDSIPPFAGEDTCSDLWRCYQETQGVPALSICKEEFTLAETLQDVTNQLQAFETNSRDFDDFVNELAEKE